MEIRFIPTWKRFYLRKGVGLSATDQTFEWYAWWIFEFRLYRPIEANGE